MISLAFPRTFSDNPPTANTKRYGCRSPELIGGLTATWRLFYVCKKHGLSTLVPMVKAVREAFGLASFRLAGLRTRTRLTTYPFAGMVQGFKNVIGAKTMTAYTAQGAPKRTATAHNPGKTSLFTFVVSIANAGGVRYVCTLANSQTNALLNAMSHLAGNASDYRLGIFKMGGCSMNTQQSTTFEQEFCEAIDEVERASMLLWHAQGLADVLDSGLFSSIEETAQRKQMQEAVTCAMRDKINAAYKLLGKLESTMTAVKSTATLGGAA